MEQNQALAQKLDSIESLLIEIGKQHKKRSRISVLLCLLAFCFVAVFAAGTYMLYVTLSQTAAEVTVLAAEITERAGEITDSVEKAADGVGGLGELDISEVTKSVADLQEILEGMSGSGLDTAAMQQTLQEIRDAMSAMNMSQLQESMRELTEAVNSLSNSPLFSMR